MPGPSAFNRRFNTMPGKTGSVGASVKKRKPAKKPLAPPPVPPSGRVNPFATKRGSK